MNPQQTVSEMVEDLLDRKANALTARTEAPFEKAKAATLKTRAARQLKELADGDYGGWKASEWQDMLPRARAEERHYSWLESYGWRARRVGRSTTRCSRRSWSV